MKIVKMATIGMVLLSSIPIFAQDAGSPLTTVTAEFQGKLDTKNAKVGDSLNFRLTGALKGSDGTAIPRGAKLIGHVTALKPHDGNTEDAQVTILIDRAEWKGGKSASIHSVMEGVQPVQDVPMADTGGGAPSGGGGRGGGGGGGGLSGGGAVSRAPVIPSATTTSAADAQPMVVPPSGAAATAGSTTVQQANGDTVKTLTAKPTQVQGLFLASDPLEPNSGTLFAKGKNVHLEDGMMFSLGVGIAPGK